jgi:plasmid maintenance system antidote protein VapI
MDTTINFRIRMIIDHFEGTQTAFADKLGVSKSQANQLAKDGGSVGMETVQKILRIYPSINPTWLVTGEDSMLKMNTTTVDSIVETYKNKISELENLISVLTENCELWKKLANKQ